MLQMLYGIQISQDVEGEIFSQKAGRTLVVWHEAETNPENSNRLIILESKFICVYSLFTQ